MKPKPSKDANTQVTRWKAVPGFESTRVQSRTLDGRMRIVNFPLGNAKDFLRTHQKHVKAMQEVAAQPEF